MLLSSYFPIWSVLKRGNIFERDCASKFSDKTIHVIDSKVLFCRKFHDCFIEQKFRDFRKSNDIKNFVNDTMIWK